tara:strand:- start:48 stop:422 length:375 start_codon:yes stop_codon:yes gene_type:complete
MEKKLEQFHNQKYINFETYKKDGSPVRTPVWFVIDNDLLYVITREYTGKVKRLRNNQNVRIVSCSFQGEPKNEWVEGKAQIITGNDADKIIKLRKKKYGFSSRLISLFTSQKGNLVVYSIQLID